jgi:hypothetical protein
VAIFVEDIEPFRAGEMDRGGRREHLPRDKGGLFLQNGPPIDEKAACPEPLLESAAGAIGK